MWTGLAKSLPFSKDLFIRYNSALTDLGGLSQITSIGGDISIRNNSALTNVDAISQITSMDGTLWIRDNSALTNVEGLGQITYIGGGLWIQNNSQLNQCCALCTLLAADAADPTVIGGTITIQNNLVGCNSEAEISTCSPCDLVSISTPEYDPAQLIIYPNPTKDILHFQYDNSEGELVNFTIENHLGQQIIQSQAYTNQPISVDISGYPAGLYIFVLQGNKSMSRLFSVSR